MAIKQAAETIQTSVTDPRSPNLDTFVNEVNSFPGVVAEAEPEADVCGCIGCRTTDRLARVRIDGFGERVLCREHVVGLVQREVDPA